MRITMIKFLAIVLVSFFGDILAVMSIPLMLYKHSGSLVESSYFTILAILSALVAAYPSALLIKKTHPLKIIMVCDILAAIFMAFFAIYAEALLKNNVAFLGVCFALGLIINFPMFAKYQLMHQYFVPESKITTFSSIQGKMYSLVVVLCVGVIGLLFEKYGFTSIMLFDSASYLPLIALCFLNRKSELLGYSSKTAQKGTSDQSLLINKEKRISIYTYYLFNGLTMLLSNMQSHMLLVVLVSVVADINLPTICMMVAIGSLSSLSLTTKTHLFFTKTSQFAVFSIVALLLVSSATVWLYPGIYSIIILGFSMAEVRGISLNIQRKMQSDILGYHSNYSMAKYSIITGSLFSSVLIYLLMWGISKFSLFYAFALLSIMIALLTAPLFTKVTDRLYSSR